MKSGTQGEVLLAVSDRKTGRAMAAYLQTQGYVTEVVDSDEKAINLLERRFFDALITEVESNRIGGLRLMKVAQDRNPQICVILIAEAQDTERATEALRQGAYDFQTPPVQLEKLEAVLRRGRAFQRLALEQVALKRRLDDRFGLGSLMGQSRQMAQVYSAVRELGATQETVLICGEPGTGKDLIAQALHNNSVRRDELFVKLDCRGLPEAVIAGELFGQLDAEAQHHRGRLELADGGTLYLEGVDALSPMLQERLLHLLEQGEYARLGDNKNVPVDLRLLASTNQRLEPLVGGGYFRRDLGEKLLHATIDAPALRARREDIPLLTEHFLQQAMEGRDLENLTLARDAVDLLMRYEWPGNVRELENVITGMVATAGRGSMLGIQDIPEHLRQQAVPEAGELRLPADATLAAIERVVILESLKRHGYHKEQAAAALGIGLRTLYRKLKEYEADDSAS